MLGSREYPKKLFGPMCYSWCNFPLIEWGVELAINRWQHATGHQQLHLLKKDRISQCSPKEIHN